MWEDCQGPHVPFQWLCYMCFQNTKNLSGEKGPFFFCVPRVSKTLGLFDFYFLKLFYVLKSNENKKKTGKTRLVPDSFVLKNIENVENTKFKEQLSENPKLMFFMFSKIILTTKQALSACLFTIFENYFLI